MKGIFPIVLAAGLSVSAAAAPIFRNPLPLSFPGVGSNLIRADFDGNGHPDVLHGAGSTNLVVHLSNGTGPFAPPVITPANWSGYTGTGDFNGDGKSDLVFSSGTHQVTVLLGNGDGTFFPGSSFSTVHTPQIALAGRFNGDPHIDLAVGMAQELSSNYYVSIHFGDGTGHFSSGQATTIAERLTNHPPVDLNGDNHMDLIGRSKVHLGNGNGGFTGITHIEDLIEGVVAVDLNHDGKRDLALTGGTFDKGVVLVRLGNGDGTFQNRVAYPAGDTYGYPSIDATDVSGDGHTDILVTAGSGITVGLLLGKGDGTFHPVQHQLVGWEARSRPATSTATARSISSPASTRS